MATKHTYDHTHQLTKEDIQLGGYGGGNMVLAFNSSGWITDRFLWGPMVDQMLADEHYGTPSTSAAGSTYFTTFDNQGSVRDLLLNDGLSGHLTYDSFGGVASTGT